MPVGASAIMLAPAVFAFGLVAFGFLGMGPVTIAVDSYGPVTDNAQSVYELSTIETIPGIEADLQKNFGFKPNFEKAKENLEENDGAGNTFKATSKPVLIGTAVVGATTMIFSTIVALTNGLQKDMMINISADARSLPARPDRRRRGHLLVHRRQRPGGHHRRLPGGGVHQEEHQARYHRQGVRRGFQEGGRNLHEVCAEGHVQHLPGGLLHHALLRVPGAVLLRRLPDLHRAVRSLPGHLHGQCRRRLG